MIEILTYAMVAALIVSAVSFVGAATLYFQGDKLKKVTHLLLCLAAGAMLGNALLHMVPHAMERPEPAAHVVVNQPAGHSHAEPHQPGHESNSDHDHDHDHEHGRNDDAGTEHAGNEHGEALPQNGRHQNAPHQDAHHQHDSHALWVMGLVVLGFFALFGLDLTLLSIGRDDTQGVKPLGYLVLVSDALENFMDGIIIGAAFLVNVPAGIAATIAIFLHEVPMELGDFAVLRHAGFSRKKALFLNFASSVVNMVGVVLAVLLGSSFAGFSAYATPIAAGAFLYLAASGLLPQIRLQGTGRQKFSYYAMTLIGVATMALILLLE